MFPTFSGNSRRPRQVNLSGRTNNPFATVKGSTSGGTNAVAQAQQERIARQQERDRLQAGKVLQKVWRGRRTRVRTKSKWREEFDLTEQGGGLGLQQYRSNEELLSQLRLLVHFALPPCHGDVERLQRFGYRLIASEQILKGTHQPLSDRRWLLLRLAKVSLSYLRLFGSSSNPSTELIDILLVVLDKLNDLIPRDIANISDEYYSTLTLLARSITPESLITLALAPLNPRLSTLDVAYGGFIRTFLCTPDLHGFLQSKSFAETIDRRILGRLLRDNLSTSEYSNLMATRTPEQLTWLLAYSVFINQTAPSKNVGTVNLDLEYVSVVTTLLSYISSKLVISDFDTSSSAIEFNPSEFVRNCLNSLVNQDSIRSLLSSSAFRTSEDGSNSGVDDESAILASYALTLLRVFPRKSDDIRSWLLLGSMSPSGTSTAQKIPAIKYFWSAVSRSKVFRSISADPNAAIDLLKPKVEQEASGYINRSQIDQTWRVILLFVELFTFVLRIMDDEEFMTGAESATDQDPWTRRNALKLSEVKSLTIFLKNLAFTMYWRANLILAIEKPVTRASLASVFGSAASNNLSSEEAQASLKAEEVVVGGANGMTMSYVRGLVTGLMRMIYERDSRRRFLPEKHWLMTDYWESEGFIQAVVEEQNYKDEVESPEDRDEDNQFDDDEITAGMNDEDFMVGTGRTRQIRREQRLKVQQEKVWRARHIASLTPRLEIMQNMPFFIPFEIRVEIFRQFVYIDQLKRRGGVTDPDIWRMTQTRRFNHPDQMSEFIGRHHAHIKRKQVLEDAFNQFYQLGDGLKEPIQITFIDEFDTPEAGIDGGGVTKEFLTSIAKEAFTSTEEGWFAENDQHLLYPNPTIIDRTKEQMKSHGIKEGSGDWNHQLREIVRRFEFLGRIVGKCLYEGILIDIRFAPFFLVKWALSGGHGSATNESGYRASINDLRDLDEGLYQGLLRLKNYSGDVEDLSLDFTVTDEVVINSPTSSNGSDKTVLITRDLRPNGSAMPVTSQNRLIYISDMARYRLQSQPYDQTRAFLKGLGSMIQPSWLSMFNQSELQTLIGGDASEIDIADLRRNTQYGGTYVVGDDGLEHPTIQMFWDVLHEISDEDRRKVLKYVTSTPRSPLLGFDHLNPKFSIRDSGSDQTRLPSTSTCVNLLKLPMYKNKMTLRDKLLYAVNSGAGFDLS